MDAPDPLTVLTCIGCGAMSELGACQSGCAEARLDLVPAELFDRRSAGLGRTRAASQAFGAVARMLASDPPDGEDLAPRIGQFTAGRGTRCAITRRPRGQNPAWLEVVDRRRPGGLPSAAALMPRSRAWECASSVQPTG